MMDEETEDVFCPATAASTSPGEMFDFCAPCTRALACVQGGACW